MQTGSSETLIGYKSGKKPLMSLNGTEWRDGGYGLRSSSPPSLDHEFGTEETPFVVLRSVGQYVLLLDSCGILSSFTFVST
jgi:hypothetical protein